MAPARRSPWWRIAARAAFALGAVAIVLLSVLPAPVIENVPAWMIFWDKLQHMIAYAAVAGCGGVGFGPGRRPMTALFAGLLALGFTLEVVQGQLPTRSFDLVDMVANTTGVVLGLGAAALFTRLVGGDARCAPTA